MYDQPHRPNQRPECRSSDVFVAIGDRSSFASLGAVAARRRGGLGIVAQPAAEVSRC
jgi:hypothetical protein